MLVVGRVINKLRNELTGRGVTTGHLLTEDTGTPARPPVCVCMCVRACYVSMCVVVYV